MHLKLNELLYVSKLYFHALYLFQAFLDGLLTYTADDLLLDIICILYEYILMKIEI